MKTDSYIRRARYVRMINNAVVELVIDLGWNVSTTIKTRLNGLDVLNHECSIYKAQKMYAEWWMSQEFQSEKVWPFTIQNIKCCFDKKEYVVEIWNHHGECLNAELMDKQT